MTRDRQQHPHRRRLSRREFVKQSAGVAGALGLTAPLISAAGTSIGSSGSNQSGASSAASPQSSALGANDAVGVGFIGIGIRGEILVRATQKIPNTRIVEVCDLYDGHFDRAKELLGPDIRTGRDYRRVLDNKDIQAVVIAVPDHWHKRMALDAMAAGKDVYVEKPMTHKWEDTAAFESAAAKHQRIVQVGSQYQSMPANERAIEIIKSGKLGQITLIDGAIHRNTGTGAWYYPVPPDASPETIDWERFLGDGPKHPFDAKRFFQWRLFWDYSGGLPTDLFVHLVTATHTLMGVEMPTRVIGVGGVYRWKPREVPDQLSAIVEYAEGFTLRLSSTANNNHSFPILRIMGTEGSLDYYGTRLVFNSEPQLENYTYSTNHFSAAMKKKFAELNDLDPESMRPRKTAGIKAPGPEAIDTPGQESTEAHLAKFYDSVRTRKQPVEDAKMGGRCAAVGHMVNLSYLAGKEARWDKQKQAVRV
jgi:predicted dehydrogenase